MDVEVKKLLKDSAQWVMDRHVWSYQDHQRLEALLAKVAKRAHEEGYNLGKQEQFLFK